MKKLINLINKKIKLEEEINTAIYDTCSEIFMLNETNKEIEEFNVNKNIINEIILIEKENINNTKKLEEIIERVEDETKEKEIIKNVKIITSLLNLNTEVKNEIIIIKNIKSEVIVKFFISDFYMTDCVESILDKMIYDVKRTVTRGEGSYLLNPFYFLLEDNKPKILLSQKIKNF